MNPLLTNRASQVPIHKLKSLCSQLHESLSDSSSSKKDNIKLEQQLWAEVKLLKTFKDQTSLTYLIGFYHTVLYLTASNQPDIDDLFHYHVLVRLGDLNRYLQRDELAAYYYSNARNLFPLFGHAYNQLGLIFAKPEALSNNYYKCCYYYARAVKSSDKSLASVAESNLRIASRSNNADILNHLLNERTHNQSFSSDSHVDEGDSSTDDENRTYPKSSPDWFYLMVIASAFDNVQPIASRFLHFMKDNFATHNATVVRNNIRSTSVHCDRDSYLLLATLDILLDWIKLSARNDELLPIVSDDLRRVRLCFQSTLMSIKYESSPYQNTSGSNQSYMSRIGICHHDTTTTTTNSSQESIRNGSRSMTLECPTSNLETSRSSVGSSIASQKLQPALPHDQVLRGFKPLDQVHRDILFCNSGEMIDMVHRNLFGSDFTNNDDDVADNSNLVDPDHLKQILLRITNKLDSLGVRAKKKSRNIALESILSRMHG